MIRLSSSMSNKYSMILTFSAGQRSAAYLVLCEEGFTLQRFQVDLKQAVQVL